MYRVGEEPAQVNVNKGLLSGKEINIGTPRYFGPDPVKDFHFLLWHVLMKFWSTGNMEEECSMNVLHGAGD